MDRSMIQNDFIINLNEPILVTGAAGFIGVKVVQTLIDYGYKNIRCFVRPSSDLKKLNKIISLNPSHNISIFQGNLLSMDDCVKAVSGISVVYHLAAGVEKSFAGCVMNSAVSTRNLIDSILTIKNFKRIVNVSSIAVYSTQKIKNGGFLDETCPSDRFSHLRHEAYVYGKIKQDELIFKYYDRFKLQYVIVRPGDVFGPGKRKLSGRVGIDSFGVFLHLGGSNLIPLTYIDNCAEAIVLAGLRPSIDGSIFNIVDDDLPNSRSFLKQYKRNVNYFFSIYLPYPLFYFLCFLWERYSQLSNDQIPPVFNRRRCSANWKNVIYSNSKAKSELGWNPTVPMQSALNKYFNYMKDAK
jgi:nucleoside-diphosphate-sugar epimerase